MTADTGAGTGDGREALLRAATRHVPFDGWSDRALRAGARELGVEPKAAIALFPGGGPEMIELHSRLADRDLADGLAARDIGSLRVRERIAVAVRLRLEQAAGDREAVRRAVTVLAMPTNAALGARLLYATVDTIWRAAGDTATDWNFYTKRGLLAGVYGSTLLFWLQDGSSGFADTWSFLDRRIDEVMRVPQATGRLRKLFDPRRNPFRRPVW